MAELRVLRGIDPPPIYPIERESSVLGRHPDCDMVLGVDSISRYHAKVTKSGKDFFIEDVGSRNGTWVNGIRIEGQHHLKEGDKIKICDVVLSFHDGQATRLETPGLNVTMAMLMDDQPMPESTIMSSLDVSSSGSALRVKVNTETKLRALMDIAKSLGKATGLDSVLQTILDSLFKVFIQADRAFIVLKAGPNGPLVPRAVKLRKQQDADGSTSIRISRTIANKVMESKEVILSADAVNDDRFEMSASLADFRIRSMMCAPLVDSEGTALGILQIDTLDQRSKFQPDDLDVLASVATQAAFAVENAQLHEDRLTQQALERDLLMAKNVQKRLLPSAPPDCPGFGFCDYYEAAKMVGGDFYDYVELPGNRIGIILADVSGKGMPAALLVAKISADIRYCLASEQNPAKAMERLNTNFIRGGWEDRFVTLVLCVLHLDTAEVEIVNCGHMAPILRRTTGDLELIGEEEAGLPIGVDVTPVYEVVKITLQPGESLTIYTDGFSEAMNADKEQYGFDRMYGEIRKPGQTVVQMGKNLLTDVKKFVGDTPQSDDMCMVCFGRNA